MRTARPRPPLARTVADAIAAEISGAGQAWLPPMAELSRRFGVSRPTVIQAARMLREQGLVEVFPGRRMRVVGEPVGGEPLPSRRHAPAAERFARFLEGEIETGTYRAGEELPKQAYFAAELAVSMRTVRQAYAQLARRGMVHRKGRGWVAGPPRKRGSVSDGGRRPIVAVAVRKEQDWRSLHGSARTRRFVEAFDAEAEKFGIDTVIAILDEGGARFVVPTVAGPDHPLNALARELGPQFLGTLVANNTEEMAGVGAALKQCVRMRKPTVWFDRSGARIDDPPPDRFYACCRYSEESVVRAAVTVLADLGHRRAAYVHLGGSEGWARLRGAMLAGMGANHNPPIDTRVIHSEKVSGGNAERWLIRALDTLCRRQSLLTDYFRELVAASRMRQEIALPDEAASIGAALFAVIRHVERHAPGGGFEGVLETYARLARITPAMLQALSDRDTTALVVSRDIFAFRCVQWLTALGVNVPQDVSVLSFDNDFGRRPRNLASVDPGFGSLGYSAFHFIFGDILPRRDSHGTIHSQARISRWGTLAPARKGRLSIPAWPTRP